MPSTSKRHLKRHLNTQTSPQKAFNAFQTPTHQVLGGFWMSRERYISLIYYMTPNWREGTWRKLEIAYHLESRWLEAPISLGLSWTLTKPFGSGYRHLFSPWCTSPSDTFFPLDRQLHVMKVWSVCCDVMILDTWLFNVSLLDIYTNHNFI